MKFEDIFAAIFYIIWTPIMAIFAFGGMILMAFLSIFTFLSDIIYMIIYGENPRN